MALFGRGNLTVWDRIKRVLKGSARRQAKAGEGETSTDWTWEERRELYQLWEAMYANSVYDDAADGGHRETILRDFIKKEDTTLPLHGWYAPVGPIVECYQNAVRGRFGKEIKPVAAAEGKELNKRLTDPLARVWRWSNLDESKSTLQRWAAMTGSAGLRIEAVTTTDDGSLLPPERRRSRIVPVHPREIVDFNEDAQGNVTDVLLEYEVREGPLGDRDQEPVTYRQTLTKESFRIERDDVTIFSGPNDLGVCPFVLLRHTDLGGDFGVPAFYGSVPILHQINWLYTRTGISVDRHVFAKWFAAAGGSAPSNFDLGDTTVAYVQTNPGDTTPKLEAVVAKLDFNGVRQILQDLVAHVRQRQPELILASLEALSGQSGETIAKLLVPCEQAILEARARYEHAMTRALKIALSWGVLMESWDLGTGRGTRDAADRAYEEGFEDFAFNDRAALPPTVFDKIKQAEADVKADMLRVEMAAKMEGFASIGERLRTAGREESEVNKIVNEMRTQDVAMEVAMNPPAPTGGGE